MADEQPWLHYRRIVRLSDSIKAENEWRWDGRPLVLHPCRPFPYIIHSQVPIRVLAVFC